MSSITKNVSFIEGVSADGNSRVRVEFRRSKLPPRWLVAALAIPMLIATGISAYLMWVTMTGSTVAGCTGGQLFDCSHVIYSKWSKAFGLPVSGFALLTYLGMITAAAVTINHRFTAATREFAWTIVNLLAISAALAALYFIYLQVFVLEHLCPWCLAAHACGLLIASTVLLASSRLSLGKLSSVTGLAGAGLALLIGVQVNSEERPKFELFEYVPETSVLADTPATSPQTFTSAAADEASEDSMMAPPSDNDGIFAPPTEAMDFLPPSEDTSAEPSPPNVSYRYPHLKTSVAITTELFMFRSPMNSALLYQEQGSSSKKQEPGSNSKAQASGSASKQQDSGSASKTQTAESEKPEAEPEKKVRVVQFLGRKLNAYQWPIDGSPTAKHVFVEMFDYTCSHCRSTGKAISKVKEQMGDDLSIIVLPVPMNTRCNSSVTVDHQDHQEACELATLAVAVWRVAPEKFSEFHHWLMEGEKCPTYSVALAKAGEMVGSEAINAELQKGTSAAFVTSHTKMYQMMKNQMNNGAVPKLLFPTTAIQGEYTSVQSLTDMIREKAAQ